MTDALGAGAAHDAAPNESDALWDEADAADAALASDADDGAGDAPEWDAGEDEARADDGSADHEDDGTAQDAPAASDWSAADVVPKAEFDRLKADREALEQRIRSDEGRVAAFQRKYEEALAASRKAQADPVEDEEMRAFKEDYPEVAAPILKIQNRLNSQIAELAAAEDGRRAATIAAEAAKMDAKHPDWRKVAETKQDVFRVWFEQQPADLQDKARRNAEFIVNADEAADVMGRFKTFLTRFEAAADPSPSANSRRERQLRGSATPPPRPQTGVTPGIPANGDPDAIWAAMDRADAAKAARQRR